jgi:long-chain fatty acid transport protein
MLPASFVTVGGEMRGLLVLSAVLGVAVGVTGTAHAGGFEYPGAGTRALGRGGAFMARADDGMTLLYDPAGLAYLSGMQLGLNFHLGFLDACFQRRSEPLNTYQDGADGTVSVFGALPPADPGEWSADRAYPEVCNDGPPGPSPDLIFTHRVNEQFGYGVGVLAPFAMGGHSLWGDEDGIVTDERGIVPSAARYMLMEQQLILLYPSVGAGYSPVTGLSVGATFQWGLGFFEYRNQTRASAGEGPGTDVLSELRARDLFVPRVITSVHYTPIDELDVVAMFHWSADVHAAGDADLTYASYAVATEGGTIDGPIRTKNEYENVELESPQPWSVGLGARYANRITQRPRDVAAIERLSGRVEDPMSNERWDIELDVVYERNSAVDDFVIHFPDEGLLTRRWTPPDPSMPADMGAVTEDVYPIPRRIEIPHRWKDQLSFRLGGDYNVIPGMAAVRAGVSFETNGVDERYANIDFWPTQRIGAHVGLTARLGRFDVSLAYAHFFNSTTEVAPADAALPQISADENGNIINAGTYKSSVDVVSLGVNWHL